MSEAGLVLVGGRGGGAGVTGVLAEAGHPAHRGVHRLQLRVEIAPI